MAERVGFEPTIPVKVCPLSRRIVSTTHAPLRKQLSANFSHSRFLAALGMTELKRGFGQQRTTNDGF